MAGDWIKMRTGLLTNPKVIRMARLLAANKFFMDWWTRGTSVSCDETVYELCDVTVVTRVTVGSLLSVWASVNECAGADGFVKGITLFEVDEMAGVPGFGDAMEAIGWVEETDEGLVFPNFSEHNTTGKERSSSAKTGAQRTKEWRERNKAVTRHRDVAVTSQSDHREEKRREESKEQHNTHSAQEPDSANAGAPEAMTLEWRPDENLLKAYAARAGIPVDLITHDAIGVFVCHYAASGRLETHVAWVSLLVKWIKRDSAQAKASNISRFPARQSNGPDFHTGDTSWADDLGEL